ncbi:class I SAM-dependent DNA methyltransferase [Leucothrix pacifica]|uniref:Class I SAM-dependent methyltransferase n=1 Tax=Leucothrix pacifica TaxID=1247513 RepID=A0A317CA58_9GAMM|nr:class I SAM-dependent methyltransferase [Leucothrix pacifica]PWQ95494.1 class I SAM-dependent methyltransferase [Leucothrix pacifica]
MSDATNKDYFENKAADYENDSNRVATRHEIADAISDKIKLTKDMHLMDFGSGTGMLLERIAPQVAKITAVDISASMNEQLRSKQDDIACELEILQMDLCTQELPQTFDGIISSMTMHHIDDVPDMFTKMHLMMKPGGFIALADLETEDGSFHTEDTGVFHYGFSADDLIRFATDAGFKKANVSQASVISKPGKDYPVLLLTAQV